MNILSCFLFILLPSAVDPVSLASDTSGSKFVATAGISINSNGIAAIPAFSLGEPAIIASVSLRKKRFSYDPALAYDLDFRPWFIDNWFHYRIMNRQEFELRTGINFSSFFSGIKLPEKEVHQSERYLAFELASFYKPYTDNVFSLVYWRDMGMDEGTIKGHFLSFSWEKSGIGIRNIQLTSGLQFFYINYDGNNDGFFVTPRLSALFSDTPLTLFFQATQVLQSNIEPSPGFRWNVGLTFSFL